MKKSGGAMGLVVVGLFAGCGAGAEGDGGYADPAFGSEGEDVDVAGSSPVESALAACPSFTSTLDQHVVAGRAHVESVPFFIFTFRSYYTVVNQEPLGNDGNQTVTLYPALYGGYTTDASQCGSCGNGLVEAGAEVCDGADMAGQTCASFGYLGGGALGCSSRCDQIDTSACLGACGNGVTEPSEFCDGNDPAISCAEFRFQEYVGGSVGCGSDCQPDTSACQRPVCGNGKYEINEMCDGADLGMFATCTQLDGRKYTGGQLRCDSRCGYDVSSCKEACGDGVLQPQEYCDGNLYAAQFAGKSCKDFQYPHRAWPFNNPVNYGSGQLACTSCGVSYSACRPLPGCYFVWSGGRVSTYTVQCY